MPSTTQLTTAADLLHMPDDGMRYELVRDTLITMPPVGNIQGHQTMRLDWRLTQHVEANGLGIVYAAETGFKLASNPDTVRGADIAFVSKTRLRKWERWKGAGRGLPIWRWR